MADVTLFEVHLPDAQFTSPFTGASESSDDRSPEPDTRDGDDTGPGPVLILLILLGIALLAWFLRNGEEAETEEDDGWLTSE